MKERSRHTTGQAGEHLVAAELARYGYTVALPTGNAEAIDILAYGNNKAIPIQVKTVSKGDHQFNVGKFIQIEFEGDLQHVKGVRPDIDRRVSLVLVFLGSEPGTDEFLWTTVGEFADFLAAAHKEYLRKHGGKRPGKNPKSLHSAIKKSHFKADLPHRTLPEALEALEDWASMDETAYLLSSPENARRLRESIRAPNEGRGVTRDRIEE